MMDLGFRSDPNLHRAQKRPIQSADRSTGTVGGVGQSIRRTWKKQIHDVRDRKEKDDGGLCGNVAKATKNKKNKEGRHVGLDFYDLLIEALRP